VSRSNPWVDSPAAAQAELIALAQRWTGQYSSLAMDQWRTTSRADRRGVFLSGHQPELFHPGVWYKNFVLAAVAGQTQTWGINLLIDQDLIKTNTVVVPSDEAGPLRRRVPFDYGGVGLPFAERRVEQFEVLRTFPERVAANAASWVRPELVAEMWPEVLHWSRELAGLGYGFAAARHLCEQRAGNQNLEVPLSWVCQTTSFAQFVVRILACCERFVACYNQGLDEYRLGYGLTGRMRPMPDLVTHDAWMELPFWIWSAQHPWRKRLMVRRTPDGWQLSVAGAAHVDLQAWQLELKSKTAVAQLLDLPHQQIRLRPRALMTTLYSRGILSQAFLHGIGGALYDQMTDRLAHDVFHWRLPDFAIATATVHLGQPATEIPARQRPLLQRYLRDLQFAPERIPAFAQQHPQWVADKQALLAAIPPPGRRSQWQQRLENLLAEARRWTAAEIAATQRRLATLATQLQQQALMTDREWSYVLFSHDLPQELQRMARAEFGNCQ
jgi:hypothetical protein